MKELDFYKIWSVISPILASILTAGMAYFFTLKSRKFDILYQYKIAECKEVILKLVEFKIFCVGRMAYMKSSEVSPHWEENSGSLHHRMAISTVVELNSFYLSPSVRATLDDLINEMSFVCNAELWVEGGEEQNTLFSAYETIIVKIEQTIKAIRQDLK